MRLQSASQRFAVWCLSALLFAGGAVWMPRIAAQTLRSRPATQQELGHAVYVPLLRALHGYKVIDLGLSEPFVRPDNNTPSVSGPTADGVVAITVKRNGRFLSYRWRNGSSTE